MEFTTAQWALGALTALLIGFAKTGVPGAGILSVPLLAALFGGRPSVGVMLPMLIFADLFAVAAYRRYAQWTQLRLLIVWGLTGLILGTGLLWALGEQKGTRDSLNVLIGALVLVMVLVQLARERWGERVMPKSRLGRFAIGSAAGFSTTVSNAAGPIISLYLRSLDLPKEQFMGTNAWYFFVFNTTKLPLYVSLTLLNPASPIITPASLFFDLLMFPMIVIGALVGKWLLPCIPQKTFDAFILLTATAASLWLIFIR